MLNQLVENLIWIIELSTFTFIFYPKMKWLDISDALQCAFYTFVKMF